VTLPQQNADRIQNVIFDFPLHCFYIEVQSLLQAGDRIMHIPPAINCEKYLEESRGEHKPTRYSRERRIYRRGAIGGWHYRDV